MFAARKLLNFHAASQRRIKAPCVVGASVDRPRTVVQNGKVSSAGARPVNWPAHNVNCALTPDAVTAKMWFDVFHCPAKATGEHRLLIEKSRKVMISKSAMGNVRQCYCELYRLSGTLK